MPEASPISNSSPELPFSAGLVNLRVIFDVPAGAFHFEWARADDPKTIVARGLLGPVESNFCRIHALGWKFEDSFGARVDFCGTQPTSVRALLKRIRRSLPLADDSLSLGLFTDADLGMARAGCRLTMKAPPGIDTWKWLGRELLQFVGLLELSRARGKDPAENGRTVMHLLVAALLGVAPTLPGLTEDGRRSALELSVTFDQVRGLAEFVWSKGKNSVAVGRVRCTGANQLTWDLEADGKSDPSISSHRRNSVRAALARWLERFPTDQDAFTAFWIKFRPGTTEPLREREEPFDSMESVVEWLEDNLVGMAEALRFRYSPLGRMLNETTGLDQAEFERYERKAQRKEQKRFEAEQRRREEMARLAEARRLREERAAQARKAAEVNRPAKVTRPPEASASPSPRERPPLPPVPVHFEEPALEFQETAFPLTDLREYALRERASLWWVSNQSDDLLCLPACRIQRLEYQIRTALRVLGPLRGRALLSDEVGLGKTIEAGLVIKELLTRGMVKRFLVLTVPSLVDQWEEELNDKFGLTVATTNQAEARGNPQAFWSENVGIVASLHTLKQPAQLELARLTQWGALVVDEAHYLRNRDSQAWQAVNALPRQFLLLLTATPVQNSLEELYNLVTLLQPGQLPTPKEFRARFLDPKRPRQPREPEELRRLLGQVMIRNTRSNCGVRLPPRRAETALFEPEEVERAFWTEWEAEFRTALARLDARQTSLWGRLVLQAAGSSPAAWRSVLEKFPDAARARQWRHKAPLESSWRRKCALIPPLTRDEGGAVVFTQFLETQAALAESLRGAGVRTFVINGSTPPPERQPITEDFRRQGGALLLTHSGAEGRNLQFCHCLVNFDLPWNPMEIEQRIGRLHRLGQAHPVRIYNFVQAGTLQEHLLAILQEKLNLFELVVGETGLVLGDRFGGEDFGEEILRRWRENEGRVAEAMARLGDELASARGDYDEVKRLDETLFAKDYESI